MTTIRAYHKQSEFIEQSESKVDYNLEAYYSNICANRWLAIRLEFIGNFVVFFAALFAVLAVVFPDASRTITPGLAGLSVSYALQVNALLCMCTVCICISIMFMVCVCIVVCACVHV